MSWSIHGIVAMNAEGAKAAVAASTQIPEGLKSYIATGIDGLVDHYGAEVLITVTGQGHLCADKSSYEVTTASVHVSKAAAG